MRGIAEFVDTHMHLWDLDRPWYWTLFEEPESRSENSLGDYRPLQHDYLIDDYIADVAPTVMRKCVHVTACNAPVAFVAETAWLQGLADTYGHPAAIIGALDHRPSAPPIGDQLDQHGRFVAFRGVREAGRLEFQAPEAAELAARLQRDGLVLELLERPARHVVAAAFAAAHPNLRIAVQHAGWPKGGDPEHLERWRRGVSALAAQENIVCKISGLGMSNHRWTVADLRPYVEHCLQEFGVQRCMFGSNFPIDSLYSDFVTLLAAFDELTASCSADERAALFASNAERFYGI